MPEAGLDQPEAAAATPPASENGSSSSSWQARRDSLPPQSSQLDLHVEQQLNQEPAISGAALAATSAGGGVAVGADAADSEAVAPQSIVLAASETDTPWMPSSNSGGNGGGGGVTGVSDGGAGSWTVEPDRDAQEAQLPAAAEHAVEPTAAALSSQQAGESKYLHPKMAMSGGIDHLPESELTEAWQLARSPLLRIGTAATAGTSSADWSAAASAG